MTMQINIKAVSGWSVKFNINKLDSVEELRNEIHDQLNFTQGPRRIMFSGQKLEDGHSLAEYDIQEGSELLLLLSIHEYPQQRKRQSEWAKANTQSEESDYSAASSSQDSDCSY